MPRRSRVGVTLALVAVALFAAVGAGSYAQTDDIVQHEQARVRVLARQLVHERRIHEQEMRRAAARFRPDVQKALTIAAATFGVDRARMAAITWRESRWRPWAKNPHSTAGGLAQFLDTTWATTPCGQVGLSRFDPYAAAMCMAWYVAHHGWRAWAL